MLVKFKKLIFKYLKNMKTCAPRGATGIGCKCYLVQLVMGSTVFHRSMFSSENTLKLIFLNVLAGLLLIQFIGDIKTIL